ncbi:VWA domain-containing protein [Actinosynnema sp. NPDC020468]|uniref:VWA domain-containing protein n=1 Tax=Actinosynnema sp. NPDC020468 TaxID=3154488 RepID=UPI0033E6C956
MDVEPGFDLRLSQSRHLSTEDDRMHAAIAVTATGPAGSAAATAEVAQVIAVDCSGSMSHPATKIAAAVRGTKAAVDALRENAWFAVIEGTHGARQVYPPSGLVRADPTTRREAKAAVQKLYAFGGTAMSTWLRLAGQVLAGHPSAVRHVILLTDGQNDPHDDLESALADCRSRFTCDARGVGTDWQPTELLRIAEVLHGTADAIRRDADLAADFTAMTGAAMAKLVPELRIVVKTVPGARVDFLHQRHPAVAELHGEQLDARTTSFDTGSWGAESREYHLRITVDSTGRPMDTDTRIARVDLQARAAGSGEFRAACAPQAVLAHWTDDLALSSRIDPRIAHFTGQTELREAVLAGSAAYEVDDLATAAARWGTAVRLATASGNERVLERLLRLVDVVGDPADGVVTIKDDVAVVDLLSMAVGSTLSSVSPDSSSRHTGSEPPPAATGPGVVCPACGREWPAGSLFCGGCRARIGA